MELDKRLISFTETFQIQIEREYDQEIKQSKLQTNPWHRE